MNAQPITPGAWLWPDQRIAAQDSRTLREAHNQLVNVCQDLITQADGIAERIKLANDEGLAPDLLAACKGAVEAMGMHGPCTDHDCRDCKRAWYRLHDAIANSEGVDICSAALPAFRNAIDDVSLAIATHTYQQPDTTPRGFKTPMD